MDKYIYPALFESSEDGGYCITFPDLPGCITEGDTLTEALTMAKDALELHLYGMEDDGDEIPTLHRRRKSKHTQEVLLFL